MSGRHIQYKAHNTFDSRVEVLRNGGVVGMLHPIDAVEVQCIGTSELKLSMRGTFEEPKIAINYQTDRLRPVATINGVDCFLGQYIATTPKHVYRERREEVEIEAYSLLYLAQRKRTEGIYHIAAGTNYIVAIEELLKGAGLLDYDAEETTEEMATDREDWEEGTPYLEIVNELLAEINYDSAWIDLSGRVRLTKYVEPKETDIKHVYRADDASVLVDRYTYSDDTFGRANVFKAVCENPELEEPLIATAVNDDPLSPWSTINLGTRVLDVEIVDNVPDQATLTERVKRKMQKSKYRTETIEFVTAIMPGHETYDVVAIDNGDATGLYREQEWRIQLAAGGEMTHKAERVIV